MEARSKPLSGDENRDRAFLIVALLFCVSALLSVLLRLFVRIRILRSTGWDDYLISLAMVSLIDIVNMSDNIKLPSRESNLFVYLGSINDYCRVQHPRRECRLWTAHVLPLVS